MKFEMFGGGFQRARKEHNCWCCGRKINKGEGYWKTKGKVGGRMFEVKHCRTTCECVPEILDQNPQLVRHVFSASLAAELKRISSTR